MKIECPKCFETKEFAVKSKIVCSKCNEDLSGCEFRKPIMSGMAILAIGIFGGNFVEYAITDNRYPLNIEYSLIDSCVNSYEKSHDRNIYIDKRETCLCAMEETMNEISYIRYKVNKNAFYSSFRKNSTQCLKRQG